MKVERTELPGVLVVEPRVHRDERGFFVESYHEERYRCSGIADRFVQDNHSRSARSTLRGLHLQRTRLQAKLVRALRGTIWDVAVDVRAGSPTFGRWVGVELDDESFRQLYIPAGFAHGFCVLSEVAEVAYKCSEVYDADDEIAVAWDDPGIGISWPVDQPLLSDRDRSAATLSELAEVLPRYRD